MNDLPELLETSLLYQSQYYWIDRCGPVAHAGYALMLEGLAAKEGKGIVEIVEKHHGRSAASYLRIHVQDDITHYDQGIGRFFAASDTDLVLAIENLKQCRQLYSMMLKVISAGREKQSP